MKSSKLSAPESSSGMSGGRLAMAKYVMRIFCYFLLVSFFILFIAILAYPLGNERLNNSSVFGSFDSTGAAIILVGMPYILLQMIPQYFS